MVKNLPAMQETWVQIPWRRACQPTPVFSPGESHGQRSLVGYSPWGGKELDTTERQTVSLFFFFSASPEPDPTQANSWRLSAHPAQDSWAKSFPEGSLSDASVSVTRPSGKLEAVPGNACIIKARSLPAFQALTTQQNWSEFIISLEGKSRQESPRWSSEDAEMIWGEAAPFACSFGDFPT